MPLTARTREDELFIRATAKSLKEVERCWRYANSSPLGSFAEKVDLPSAIENLDVSPTDSRDLRDPATQKVTPLNKEETDPRWLEAVADWIADGASAEDVLNGVQENNPFLRQRPEPELSHLSELIAKPAQGGVRDLRKIWRVNQFAASGIVLLAADSGTGKTTLMNLCVEEIQEGLRFWGRLRQNKRKHY